MNGVQEQGSQGGRTCYTAIAIKDKSKTWKLPRSLRGEACARCGLKLRSGTATHWQNNNLWRGPCCTVMRMRAMPPRRPVCGKPVKKRGEKEPG